MLGTHVAGGSLVYKQVLAGAASQDRAMDLGFQNMGCRCVDKHGAYHTHVAGRNGRQLYQELSDAFKLNVVAFHDIDEKKVVMRVIMLCLSL